ncbi:MULTISPECIES: hypothetical protein [Ruminococcus]|uniref:Uncharacterized protein n=1 Tax=Ruminococcus albus (strain ATCC 27210 / DSM 20455 / JCM 14654 / NCDO 2250 / 7) TaxID=697329 RepID=E6UBQ9_RUMA7|nr:MULTISPECIES: hypothetical protein [Ruminococcus]ADU20651.1 hypothetical protein Rumal_0089 [Ruminococcus albus 7 = DSM 20455]MCR5020286.1 hypothetical protein [Ruminococcus sp.]
MKRSRLLRRLMTLSVVSEVIYMFLITVLLIFRPAVYDNTLIKLFDLDISEIPAIDPDKTLTGVLFGGIILYFILWFLLKLMMDKDMDPLIIGILSFLMLPASTVVYRLLYSNVIKAHASLGADYKAFTTAHFRVMEYCGWANLAAFIFMLMAYAVCRQRFSDLD